MGVKKLPLALCFCALFMSFGEGNPGFYNVQGSHYSYDYQSSVALLGDDARGAHDLVLHLDSTLTVDTVWLKDSTNTEKILRFQLKNIDLIGWGNSTNQPIQSKSDLSKEEDTLAPLVQPFFAKYLYGKLQDFILDKHTADNNPAVANVFRAVASLFQFQSGNWEGSEQDIIGSCWTTYTNHQTGLHKQKYKCNEKKQEETSANSRSKLLDVQKSWKYEARYVLQKDSDNSDDEIIAKVVLTETLKHEVNIHSNVPRRAKSTQTLILKEQSSTDFSVMGPTLDEIITKLEAKEGLPLIKSDILGTPVSPKLKDVKVKNLIPKIKKQLQPSSLATVAGAKAFLQTLETFGTAKKDEIVSIIKDKKFNDILPQVMDVLAQSGSSVAFSVALETFANPVKTTTPDLCERFLWAVSQVRSPDAKIIHELFEVAKTQKISNLKVKETLILTLGTLSAKTSDARLSTEIVKWLVHSMVEGCKNDNCVQMFLRSLENTENPSSGPILLKLAETSSKKTAFYALKSFSHLYSLNEEEMKAKLGSTKIVSRIETIFLNEKIDSSVRTIAGEMLLKIKPELSVFYRMFNCLKNETKGFKSLILSRVIEFMENDYELRNTMRSCVSRGVIDWDLLAHGGLSTSFGRQIGSAGRGGNSSFSFGMEVSGVVMKRSNFQLFFTDKSGLKKELVQLGVFASGLSSFIDDSSSDDSEDATAGIEIKFLGNQLRPFIVFSSMGELMSLYWSGATEQKTSALQGNSLLLNDRQILSFANGFTGSFFIDGTVSYDFSGKGTVSMWSKSSETLIENSFSYVLRDRAAIYLWSDNLAINEEQYVETETSLKVTNNLEFGNNVKVCILVSQPELHVDKTIVKSIKTGANYLTAQKLQVTTKTVVPGKTLFLNQKNCDLCNKMYPKSKI